MDKRIFVLSHTEARQRAKEFVSAAPEGWVVEFKPSTRSLEQNSKLWACLADVAKQVVWHGRKLSAEEWKFVFSSAIKKQEVVPNIDGTGFVVLGQSTSKMSKAEMSELLELILAFGAQHNVKFEDEVKND
jgi:hypothetical protein